MALPVVNPSGHHWAPRKVSNLLAKLMVGAKEMAPAHGDGSGSAGRRTPRSARPAQARTVSARGGKK